MTEAEWNACTDPQPMLEFLRRKAGDRKIRLLACACARSRWPGLVHDEYRRAIEVAEKYADGLANMDDLRAASADIWTLHWGPVHGDQNAGEAATASVDDFSGDAAEGAVKCVPDAAPALIREVFGNPFRLNQTERHWLIAHSDCFGDRAREIYDHRRFGDLPALADHLSKLGYRDEEVLAHLRSSAPHFLGCWALDVVLGKSQGKDVVTQTEWLGESRPFHMLTWWRYLCGKPSTRKRRLLAVACCRLSWPVFDDQCLSHCVDIAEAFADGLVTSAQLSEAYGPASTLASRRSEPLGQMSHDHPDWLKLVDASHAARSASDTAGPESTLGNAMHFAARDGGHGRDTDDARQAGLIREILGNPLTTIIPDPSWFAWNNGTVPKLAEAIYTDRAFDRLPILADALEDAGCTDPNILAHCRGPGPHVRGCWVVDLLTGRS